MFYGRDEGVRAGGVAVAVIVPHFHMKKSLAEIVDGVEEAHEQGRSWVEQEEERGGTC